MYNEFKITKKIKKKLTKKVNYFSLKSLSLLQYHIK